MVSSAHATVAICATQQLYPPASTTDLVLLKWFGRPFNAGSLSVPGSRLWLTCRPNFGSQRLRYHAACCQNQEPTSFLGLGSLIDCFFIFHLPRFCMLWFPLCPINEFNVWSPKSAHQNVTMLLRQYLDIESAQAMRHAKQLEMVCPASYAIPSRQESSSLPPLTDFLQKTCLSHDFYPPAARQEPQNFDKRPQGSHKSYP